MMETCMLLAGGEVSRVLVTPVKANKLGVGFKDKQTKAKEGQWHS